MGRRTKDGRAVMRAGEGGGGLDEPMTYDRFNRVALIRGGTLDRYLKDTRRSKELGDPKAAFFWVYEPSPEMRDTGCDYCVKRHSYKRVGCSATLGVPTSMTDPDVLYSFKTQNAVALGFREVTVEEHGVIRGVVVTFL